MPIVLATQETGAEEPWVQGQAGQLIETISEPQAKRYSTGAYNSSTQEAEAGESPWDQGQPGVYSELKTFLDLIW